MQHIVRVPSSDMYICMLQVVELTSLAQLLAPVELARLATCVFIITVARHGWSNV